MIRENKIIFSDPTKCSETLHVYITPVAHSSAPIAWMEQ